MSSENTQLHVAILEYLQQLSQNPGPLDSDSIEVAMQCLAESFMIDMHSADSQSALLSAKGTSLQEVFSNGLNGGVAAPVSPKTEAEVSAEDKEEAETMKNKGNQHLSSAPHISVELYSKAIALNPFNHIYYNNRAVAHTKMCDYNEAIADAKHSIKLDGNYSKSHYRLGMCYIELKKFPEAKAAMETAIRVAKANGETTMISECTNKLNDIKALEKKNRQPVAGAGPGAAGGMDIASLLGGMDMNAVAQMMGSMGGGANGGAGGLDIAGMMQNPMMQNLMSSMMSGGGLGNLQGMMGGAGANGMGEEDEYDEEDASYTEDEQ